jgi:hypothetical protein
VRISVGSSLELGIAASFGAVLIASWNGDSTAIAFDGPLATLPVWYEFPASVAAILASSRLLFFFDAGDVVIAEFRHRHGMRSNVGCLRNESAFAQRHFTATIQVLDGQIPERVLIAENGQLT